MRKLIIPLSKLLLSVIALILFSSCSSDDNDNSLPPTPEDHIAIKQISPEMQIVRDYVPQNAVIAHRGTTYWAPESTEAAYRWARNMGADYLEADLQITKDGVVLVMHDAHMKNKTNISLIYPSRVNDPTSTFDFEELLVLDAAYPFMQTNAGTGRDRPAFSQQHQYISTLDDLIHIARGMRIKRDANGDRIYIKNPDGTFDFAYEDDPMDNGNRPGIYLELKQPDLNPGLEEAMAKRLEKWGWDITKSPATETAQFKGGKINVGNTNAKVVLQTFLLGSLQKLKTIYNGKLPTAYLASSGTMGGVAKSNDPEVYAKYINDGVDNMAQFFGPSIAGAPNNYAELLNPWQAHMIRRAKMKIHPWTFDTQEQMLRNYEGIGFENVDKYAAPPYCDAMFTNRSDLTIQYYISKGVRNGGPVYQDPNAVLNNLGY